MAEKKIPVKMNTPVKVILKNCVFDKANPNTQSDKQFASLGKSFKEFGYLGDLIVVEPLNKNKKHFVHHGEHRIKKLIDAGNTWAWGFIEKMTTLQHKAYRQTMNKLSGSHDLRKDKKELEFFAKNNKLSFLASLIAQPKEMLILEQESLPIKEDTSMILSRNNNKKNKKKTISNTSKKRISIAFSDEQYPKIMLKIKKIKSQMKINSDTDLFIKLVNNYLKIKK